MSITKLRIWRQKTLVELSNSLAHKF
jgi:hypothetical protein